MPLCVKYAVYVYHPETGEVVWFLAPGQGITRELSEAYLWDADQLAEKIQEAIDSGGDWGTRTSEIPCRIRQVLLPPEALETQDPGDESLETPEAPYGEGRYGEEHPTCPDCDGVGDSRERPYYECHKCGGAGVLGLESSL